MKPSSSKAVTETTASKSEKRKRKCSVSDCGEGKSIDDSKIAHFLERNDIDKSKLSKIIGASQLVAWIRLGMENGLINPEEGDEGSDSSGLPSDDEPLQVSLNRMKEPKSSESEDCKISSPNKTPNEQGAKKCKRPRSSGSCEDSTLTKVQSPQKSKDEREDIREGGNFKSTSMIDDKAELKKDKRKSPKRSQNSVKGAVSSSSVSTRRRSQECSQLKASSSPKEAAENLGVPEAPCSEHQLKSVTSESTKTPQSTLEIGSPKLLTTSEEKEPERSDEIKPVPLQITPSKLVLHETADEIKSVPASLNNDKTPRPKCKVSTLKHDAADEIKYTPASSSMAKPAKIKSVSKRRSSFKDRDNFTAVSCEKECRVSVERLSRSEISSWKKHKYEAKQRKPMPKSAKMRLMAKEATHLNVEQVEVYAKPKGTKVVGVNALTPVKTVKKDVDLATFPKLSSTKTLQDCDLFALSNRPTDSAKKDVDSPVLPKCTTVKFKIPKIPRPVGQKNSPKVVNKPQTQSVVGKKHRKVVPPKPSQPLRKAFHHQKGLSLPESRSLPQVLSKPEAKSLPSVTSEPLCEKSQAECSKPETEIRQEAKSDSSQISSLRDGESAEGSFEADRQASKRCSPSKTGSTACTDQNPEMNPSPVPSQNIDLFSHFHLRNKPPDDPLNALQNEELDYEAEDDPDDTISLFADPGILSMITSERIPDEQEILRQSVYSQHSNEDWEMETNSHWSPDRSHVSTPTGSEDLETEDLGNRGGVHHQECLSVGRMSDDDSSGDENEGNKKRYYCKNITEKNGEREEKDTSVLPGLVSDSSLGIPVEEYCVEDEHMERNSTLPGFESFSPPSSLDLQSCVAKQDISVSSLVQEEVNKDTELHTKQPYCSDNLNLIYVDEALLLLEKDLVSGNEPKSRIDEETKESDVTTNVLSSSKDQQLNVQPCDQLPDQEEQKEKPVDTESSRDTLRQQELSENTKQNQLLTFTNFVESQQNEKSCELFNTRNTAQNAVEQEGQALECVEKVLEQECVTSQLPVQGDNFPIQVESNEIAQHTCETLVETGETCTQVEATVQSQSPVNLEKQDFPPYGQEPDRMNEEADLVRHQGSSDYVSQAMEISPIVSLCSSEETSECSQNMNEGNEGEVAPSIYSKPKYHNDGELRRKSYQYNKGAKECAYKRKRGHDHERKTRLPKHIDSELKNVYFEPPKKGSPSSQHSPFSAASAVQHSQSEVSNCPVAQTLPPPRPVFSSPCAPQNLAPSGFPDCFAPRYVPPPSLVVSPLQGSHFTNCDPPDFPPLALPPHPPFALGLSLEPGSYTGPPVNPHQPVLRSVDQPSRYRNHCQALLTGYCEEFLMWGKCSLRVCKSMHVLPPFDHQKVYKVLQLIKEALDYPHWGQCKLSSMISYLGKISEKDAVLEAASEIWSYFCSHPDKQPTSVWVDILDALCCCGMNPAWAVEEILNKLIINPTQGLPKGSAQVLDKILVIIFPRLHNGRQLSETLKHLSHVVNYELPIPLTIEVLKLCLARDDMNLMINTYRYLLKNVIVHDNDVLHLIHQFTLKFEKDPGSRCEARSLREQFPIKENDPCNRPAVPLRQGLPSVKAQTNVDRVHRSRTQNSVSRFGTETSNSRSSSYSPQSAFRSRANSSSKQNVEEQNAPQSKTAEDKRFEAQDNPQSDVGDTLEKICDDAVSGIENVRIESSILDNHASIVCEEGGSVGKNNTETKTNGRSKQGDDLKESEKTAKRKVRLNDPCLTNFRITLTSSGGGTERKIESTVPVEHPAGPKKQLPTEVKGILKKSPRVRLMFKSINDLLKDKKFGAASNQFKTWSVDYIGEGTTLMYEGLIANGIGTSSESFSSLLQAIAGSSPIENELHNKVFSTVGLNVFLNLVGAKLWSAAHEVYSLMINRNLNPLVGEVLSSTTPASPSKTWLFWVMCQIQIGNMKKAVELILYHNMAGGDQHVWGLQSSDGDSEFRDEVCLEILKTFQRDSSADAVKLYHCMVQHQGSFGRLDIPLLLDQVLQRLVYIKDLKTACELVIWADETHHLKPRNEITARMLLIKVTSLPDEEQALLTPCVLTLMLCSPYCLNLPFNITGLEERVELFLLSNWFKPEVNVVIRFFLIFLVRKRFRFSLPEISIKIQVVDVPQSKPDEYFPPGLKEIDSSLSGMVKRVNDSLAQMKLIGYLNHNVFQLEKKSVEDFLLQMGSSYTVSPNESVGGVWHQANCRNPEDPPYGQRARLQRANVTHSRVLPTPLLPAPGESCTSRVLPTPLLPAPGESCTSRVLTPPLLPTPGESFTEHSRMLPWRYDTRAQVSDGGFEGVHWYASHSVSYGEHMRYNPYNGRGRGQQWQPRPTYNMRYGHRPRGGWLR